MSTYRTPATREEAERALDAGCLEAEMASGRFWRARRNGATKLWKTRPDDFRIPVKAGFRACGAIEPRTLGDFRIVESDT